MNPTFLLTDEMHKLFFEQKCQTLGGSWLGKCADPLRSVITNDELLCFVQKKKMEEIGRQKFRL